jgi:hypothetical protein
MALEFINGQMEVSIQANGKKVVLTALEHGRTKRSHIMESGKTVKSLAKVH